MSPYSPLPRICSDFFLLADLDGDLYSVILDPDLIPLRRNIVEPADYSPPVMNRLPRPATIDDGRDFFFDYIISDLLGVISSRHLHTADLSLQGSMDPDCIELARLQCALFSLFLLFVFGTNAPRVSQLQGRRLPQDWLESDLQVAPAETV